MTFNECLFWFFREPRYGYGQYLTMGRIHPKLGWIVPAELPQKGYGVEAHQCVCAIQLAELWGNEVTELAATLDQIMCCVDNGLFEKCIGYGLSFKERGRQCHFVFNPSYRANGAVSRIEAKEPAEEVLPRLKNLLAGHEGISILPFPNGGIKKVIVTQAMIGELQTMRLRNGLVLLMGYGPVYHEGEDSKPYAIETVIGASEEAWADGVLMIKNLFNVSYTFELAGIESFLAQTAALSDLEFALALIAPQCHEARVDFDIRRQPRRSKTERIFAEFADLIAASIRHVHYDPRRQRDDLYLAVDKGSRELYNAKA